MPPEKEALVDIEKLTNHWHPFNAECRAYARLKEVGKENLAVQCHGYVTLTDAQEKEIADRFGIDDWWEYSEGDKSHQGLPLWAIVKDLLVDEPDALTPRLARKMIRDLNELHRSGIIVNDIKEDAYIRATLVDLSRAITVPHISFDRSLGFDPDDLGPRNVWEDFSYLDEIFKDWNSAHEEGPKILARTLPDGERLVRLRSRPRDTYFDRFFDPTKFDWRNAGRRSRGRPRKADNDKKKNARVEKKRPKRAPEASRKPASRTSQKKNHCQDS